MLLERYTYSVAFTYLLWGYAAWTLLHCHEHTAKQFFLYYLVYVALELLNLSVVLYYSNNRARDLAIGLSAPLMPFYNLLMRSITLLSVTEEILTRRSFRDGFVPERTSREATWHW